MTERGSDTGKKREGEKGRRGRKGGRERGRKIKGEKKEESFK